MAPGPDRERAGWAWRCLRLLGRLALSLLMLFSMAWACLAFWYQGPGAVWAKAVLMLAWVALGLYALLRLWHGVGRLRRRPALWAYLLAVIALAAWWQGIAPSNDRVWADDVARTLRGSVAGSIVTLDNVRDFKWRSDSDYTPRWETRVYDLNDLRSVDMVLSYWDGPAIAHTLVSFGFADGRHVVFSVEIRKERGEQFSELGGFFKKFELSVVAADERDVLYVRAGPRAENVYIYPVQMPVDAMRALFLSYVRTANELADTPRFYHTVTANCTTLVYRMVRAIVPGLPLDYRILLSGYLPEYLYEQGGLDTRQPLQTLRERGFVGIPPILGEDSIGFSRSIRRHLRAEPAEGTP
ncbi:DUF4105 domain-containing protein [Achromobacter ruhlandii]|uniref:Lnb N-terminal periplasmic domain-containing protein n=1 Tax=Achromobacter ruhlandii TaxID=72557 RepID=UPI003B9950B1